MLLKKNCVKEFFKLDNLIIFNDFAIFIKNSLAFIKLDVEWVVNQVKPSYKVLQTFLFDSVAAYRTRVLLPRR